MFDMQLPNKYEFDKLEYRRRCAVFLIVPIALFIASFDFLLTLAVFYE